MRDAALLNRTRPYLAVEGSRVIAVLRGVGQIFLQRSWLSGCLFLLALALGSLRFAFAALIGSALGFLMGRLLRAPREALDEGLYGFNGALVALATAALFEPTPLVLATGAAAVLSATALFDVARRHGVAVFTAPFVACAWLMLAVLPRSASTPLEAPEHVAAIALRHIGEVVFLGGTLSGAVCLVGIFAGSWREGVVAGVVSLLTVGCGVVFQSPGFSEGLLGFNAVLTAIAVWQMHRGFVVVCLASLVATAMSWAALHWQLPMLTAPFVATAYFYKMRPLR